MSNTLGEVSPRANTEPGVGGIVQVRGDGVRVAEGRTSVRMPAGPTANLLAEYAGADVFVRGRHTTRGPAAFLPWDANAFWVRGALTKVDPCRGLAILNSGRGCWPVSLGCGAVHDGWFMLQRNPGIDVVQSVKAAGSKPEC